MRRFAQSCLLLERSRDNAAKEQVLCDYFEGLSPSDLFRATYILCGKKLRNTVRKDTLVGWAKEFADIDDWLFDESCRAVGDVSETINLILPAPAQKSDESLDSIASQCERAFSSSEMHQREFVHNFWNSFDDSERRIFNKIMTGAFRSPVAAQLLVRSLSRSFALEIHSIAKLLADEWRPDMTFADKFAQLRNASAESVHAFPFATSSPFDYAVIAVDLKLTESSSVTLGATSNGASTSDAKFCAAAVSADDSSFSKALDVALPDNRAFDSTSFDILSDSIGDVSDWFAEWKWDGLRAQIIKCNDHVYIWSREAELLNAQFPELVEEAARLPGDIAIDGEIVAWKDADVLPFSTLSQRMTRRPTSQKMMRDVPVVLMAFDLLFEDGVDFRSAPIEHRRERLADVLSTRRQSNSNEDFEQLKLFAPCMASLSQKFRLSPVLQMNSWEEANQLRLNAREMKTGGLVLKRKSSTYPGARASSPASTANLHKDSEAWRAWKTDPLRVDTVLVAAQSSTGANYGLCNDFTLALWHEGELLSFARAIATLSEDELASIDSFIKENTLERFGPLRRVKPELVFELEFDSVQNSNRYKSGIVARSPRIKCWHQDKNAIAAASLSMLSTKQAG